MKNRKDDFEFSSGDVDGEKNIPKSIKGLVSWCARTGCYTIGFMKLIGAGMNPFDAKKLITESIVGLKTNSIIGNPLHYPDPDDKGRLMFQNTSAGLWNAYDFQKPFSTSILKEKNNFASGVNFLFFPIDDVVTSDSPIDKETHEGMFHLFYFDHMVHMSKMKIQEALDYGALEEVTYETAYKKVGNSLWEQDVRDLGISEKTVFQVTPKGSTLIIPRKIGGSKTPPLPDSETEGAKDFEPAYT